MIKLGSRVKDRISGFTGIAVARTEWLYNCVRLSVQPESLHEGKPIEAHSFDEDQLEVLAEMVAGKMVDTRKPAVTGGDRPSITRAADPKR